MALTCLNIDVRGFSGFVFIPKTFNLVLNFRIKVFGLRVSFIELQYREDCPVLGRQPRSHVRGFNYVSIARKKDLKQKVLEQV